MAGRCALKSLVKVSTVELGDSEGQGEGHDDGGARSINRTSFLHVDEGQLPWSRDSRAILSEDLPNRKTRNSTKQELRDEETRP